MKKFFITSDSIECANFIGHIGDNWHEVYLWLKNEKRFDNVAVKIHADYIFDKYQDAKDFIIFTLENSAKKLPVITHTRGFYPSVGDEFYCTDVYKTVLVKLTKIISNILFTLENSVKKLPVIKHKGGFYPSVGDEFYDIGNNKIVIVKVTKIISDKEVVVKQFNPNTKSYSEEYITKPINFRTTINGILECVLHKLEKDRLMFYDNNLL